MGKGVDVSIRWLIRRDMPEVLRIERESFEFPWTDEDFVGCLRQRNCIGMVCEWEHEIVGFMVYELHKSAFRILNLAVDPMLRRVGIGRQMIERLRDKLSQQRRSEMQTEVRERNIDAQRFFKAMGFSCIETIRTPYEDTDEDAYVMRYTVDRREDTSSPYHPKNRISEYLREEI